MKITPRLSTTAATPSDLARRLGLASIPKLHGWYAVADDRTAMALVFPDRYDRPGWLSAEVYDREIFEVLTAPVRG